MFYGNVVRSMPFRVLEGVGFCFGGTTADVKVVRKRKEMSVCTNECNGIVNDRQRRNSC